MTPVTIRNIVVETDRPIPSAWSVLLRRYLCKKCPSDSFQSAFCTVFVISPSGSSNQAAAPSGVVVPVPLTKEAYATDFMSLDARRFWFMHHDGVKRLLVDAGYGGSHSSLGARYRRL